VEETDANISIGKDYDLWNIMLTVPLKIIHITGTKVLEKFFDRYTPKEHQRVQKNYRAMILCLDVHKFNQMSACDIAKDFWASR